MRKLVAVTFVTLDGVMQAPGAPDEDREGGFAHGGWVVPHFDEQGGAHMVELIQRAGALLLGRKTYDIFAASWPHAPDTDPIAAVYNRIPKYVASRSPRLLSVTSVTDAYAPCAMAPPMRRPKAGLMPRPATPFSRRG